MIEDKKLRLIHYKHNEGRAYRSSEFYSDDIGRIVWEINRFINDPNITIEGLVDDDGNYYFLEFDKENPWKLVVRKQDDTDKNIVTERQIERELSRYRKEVEKK